VFRKRPPLPPFPPGALLVGGAARDLLRGQTPKDYDWITPDPAGAARALARELGGHAFPLDEVRNFWRVTVPGAQHDFVPLPADLHEDLQRRDFTVNAIALQARGRSIDPTGGLRDLKRGTLRMISEANLRDDPLRLVRAARLGVTLGFTLDPATRDAVIRLAHDATMRLPAAERVRDELTAMLRHADAARGVLLMRDLGLLHLHLPELLEGSGVRQGGLHHLDVFEHNVEALHQLLARFPDADLTLRWAALLHDIGKPRTAAPDEMKRRTTFHGHERVGAAITRDILTRLRYPGALVERAAALVKAHMLPLPHDEREARRFVHRRRELLPDLLRLMLADREAARGRHAHEGGRLAYQQAMGLVLATIDEQPTRPEPILRGEDVMRLLGVDAGPVVGEALRAIHEAQAVGDIATSDEARAYLLEWRARTTPAR